MFKKSQYVFYSCLSFILAIGLASFYILPWIVLYTAGLLIIILLIFSKAKLITNLVAVCLLFFIFGNAYYILSLPKIDENHLAFYNNPAESEFYNRQSVIFQGVVNDEPDTRSDHVKLKVKSNKLIREKGFVNIEGNVLVRTDLYPQYNYGDFLEIKCELTEPEPIEDFRYDKYLSLSKIYSLCYRGQIIKLGEDQGNVIKATIFNLKNKIVEISTQILPEPQASFLGGLLWGAKKGMPEDVLENFSQTGVTHIIAVSGYNITIIAVFLSGLFIRFGLSRKKAFWLIVLGIIFFVIITGSPASIVRAGIMGVVALISQTIGRASRMENILVLVAVVMLLFNPHVLIWDAGFQLSFLATIGLIYFVPVIEKYLKFLPQTFSIRESFVTTMSAIILTTPLILYQFGRFSFMAPLANLLILPVIPLNMAIGFVAIVLGAIWLPLGILAGYICWMILTYILKLTEILAKIEWASLPVNDFPLFLLVASYLLIGFLIYRDVNKKV